MVSIAQAEAEGEERVCGGVARRIGLLRAHRFEVGRQRERHATLRLEASDQHVKQRTVVDAELERLDLKLRTVRRGTRMVSPTAYEAGGLAGASLPITPGIRGT